MEQLFKIGPSNANVDQHVPDQVMLDHAPIRHPDGSLHLLRERFPTLRGVEAMRMILLDYLRKQIDEDYIQSKSDRIYELAQKTLYHLIFDIFGGRVNRKYLQIVGNLSGILAILQIENAPSHRARVILSKYYQYNVPHDVITRTEFMTFVDYLQDHTDIKSFMAEQMATDEQKETSRILEQAPSQSAILAHGTYGAICRPPLCNIDPITKQPVYHNNKSVSKIYFEKESANKSMKNMKALQNLMAGIPNNAFKATQHTARRGKNLGNTLLQSLLQSTKASIKETNDIHAILLPYLGKSIEDVIADPNKEGIKAFRSCEFHHIMGQLLKCQTILDRLAAQKYIHGDICSPNMMWNKDTCGIHIIDFDWLMPYDEFATEYRPHFGHSRNPPEALHAVTDPSSFRKRMDTWIDNNATMFEYEFTRRYISGGFPSLAQAIREDIIKAQDENKTFLEETMKANHLADHVEAIMKVSFPSFDSYAYVHVMLNLFAAVYPGSADPSPVNEARMIKTIESRITSQGKPYSADYLQLIASTLIRVTELYHKMGDFRLARRVNAQKGLEEMKIIYDDFMRQHVALTGAPQDVGDAKEEVANAKKAIDKAIQNEKKNNAKPDPSGLSHADLEFLKLELSKLQVKKGGRRRHKKRKTKKNRRS